jgi:hypothetical protein
VIRACSGTLGRNIDEAPELKAQIAAVYKVLAEVAQW